MDFEVGQIFTGDYPAEAAAFCNENGLIIAEIEPEDGVRRFQIQEIPAPTAEQKLKTIETAIDDHIATVMRERSYDSITSCITYLGSTNARWNSDAQDALAWRTAVWETAYDLLNSWQRGEIEELTPEQVIERLPVLEWSYKQGV